MEYEFLNAQTRAELIQQRIAQMEVEHYQHELSRTIGRRLAAGAGGPRLEEAHKMVAEAEAAQAVIEQAVEELRGTLAELRNGSAPPPD